MSSRLSADKISIKDYLARPRPTLDEIKQLRSNEKGHSLDVWDDEEANRRHKEQLERERQDKLSRNDSKKKDKKQRKEKSTKVKSHKRRRGSCNDDRSSSTSRSKSPVHCKKYKASSGPVRLSSFFASAESDSDNGFDGRRTKKYISPVEQLPEKSPRHTSGTASRWDQPAR